MSRQKFSRRVLASRFNTSAIGVLGALSLALCATTASAYEFYSDATNDQGQCGQCHTGFRDNNAYVSAAEGFAWETSLHNAHTGNMNLSNCDVCHDGSGTFGNMVNLSSSADAQDGVNFISCMVGPISSLAATKRNSMVMPN